MNKQSAIKFLNENSGYLKKSASYLADKLNISESLAKEVLAVAKNKKVAQNASNSVLKPFTKGDVNNILVIGDLHIPFERKGYLEHCRAVQEQFNCGTVLFIGDIVDNHYSSFHETNPDGASAGDELEYSVFRLKKWYEIFPKAMVTLGNHDQIIQRKAFTAGLSKRWIRGYAEVLGVPNWEFDLEFKINGVLYTHGTGTSGENAAYTKALNRRLSIVQGHLHTVANIKWNVSETDKIFAMQVGCGIDDKAYAFSYAAGISKKSIISCGVVLNKGKLPIVLPMEL